MSVAGIHARSERLVILAGAGVSAAKPSRIPDWNTFNKMLLTAVYRRASSYLDRSDLAEPFVKAILDRRDNVGTFSPDYQAQIIHELCGSVYFEAWKAVDLDQGNLCHDSIACLCTTGMVRAIITTNFDRLIERACDQRGVRYHVYRNGPEYQQCARVLTSSEEEGVIPIIKVHGSVEDASTLVDTLKQRLLGRGHDLENALNSLLRRNYWIYAGFSAADLEHNPDYLGLRGAARESPGFTYIRRPGRNLTKGAQDLIETYGQEKAAVECKPMEEWFTELCNEIGAPAPVQPPVTCTDPPALVQTRLDAWAEELDPYAGINIAAGLLEACGEQINAFHLLHKTWCSRIPQDSYGVEYARYELHYGRLCTLFGEFEYEETFQNLARARNDWPEAYIYLSLYYFWKGKSDLFGGLLREAFERNSASPEAVADAVLVFCQYCDIYGLWSDGHRYALEGMASMQKAGDLPREARLLAYATLFSARLDDFDAADQYYRKGWNIAASLSDIATMADLAYANGIAISYSKGTQPALSPLLHAYEIYGDIHWWPKYVAAGIELAHLHALLGQSDAANHYVEVVCGDIERFPVLLPRLYLTMAGIFHRSATPERTAGFLANAEESAKLLNNAGAVKSVQINRAKYGIS